MKQKTFIRIRSTESNWSVPSWGSASPSPAVTTRKTVYDLDGVIERFEYDRLLSLWVVTLEGGEVVEIANPQDSSWEPVRGAGVELRGASASTRERADFMILEMAALRASGLRERLLY